MPRIWRCSTPERGIHADDRRLTMAKREFRHGAKDDDLDPIAAEEVEYAAEEEEWGRFESASTSASAPLPPGPPPKAHLNEHFHRELREPPPWQQLPLQTCTAHAVAAALWYREATQHYGPKDL